MPRTNASTSNFRNRNRVTNKTRLKVFHGSIDADPLLLEEEEASNVLKLNTQGVDAEDANEHHLQAVLSAASQRQQSNSYRTRGAVDKSNASSAVYIPVPDSTGVVDNYRELYATDRWKDPATYIRSSETAEDSCTAALANGFTYYMDERDKEWLDKNNEEARGEGTSAQGALSTSGTTTRSGPSRSAKAKGKEPEVVQSITISEDEFELVMGLFEKVTHEKTEYLHHSLETGMAFPALSEYQDTFSSPLTPTTFAAFTVPSWVPSPAQLTRVARIMYPHWKERRVERGGLRIIPMLNGDEADTANESYICFRRREIKAVRKTRASHVTFSDKLTRLQSELAQSLELAKCVLSRENLKQECVRQTQNVWEKRLNVVELKRKFPMLGEKADEELLHDKERVPKIPKMDASSRLPGLKLRTRDNDVGSPYAEVIRPRVRRERIQFEIERELQHLKEKDNHWDDQIDHLYQQLPVPYPSRLFKHIPTSEARSSSPSSADEGRPIHRRSVRLRFGRGGRILLDRCNTNLRSQSLRKWSDSRMILDYSKSNFSGEPDFGDESEECKWRLTERWRYDADDYPTHGSDGLEEQDRVLIDDFDARFLRHTMTLLPDTDQPYLMTDATITISSADGHQQSVTPFKLGPHSVFRRDAQGRPYPAALQSQTPQQGTSSILVASGGTPISVPTQVKKMQHTSTVPQLRISSNGNMRPPGLAASGLPHNALVSQGSPTNNLAQPSINGVNGIHRSGSTAPQREMLKNEANSNHSIPNGIVQSQTDLHPVSDNSVGQSISPARPKSQNQHHVTIPNGYHLTAMNGYPAVSNASQYLHANNHNGLSVQQVQSLKSAFATPSSVDMNPVQPNGGRQITAPYMGHVVTNGANFNMPLAPGANMNLKLPPARQMQWSSSSIPRASNGVDSSVINGSLSPSPSHAHTLPVPPARTPSANGSRAGIRGVPSSTGLSLAQGSGGHLVSHSMSPHLQQQQSPSPLPSSLSQAQNQSSPRLPQTPALTMVSPSLQHQPVGSSQSGY